MRKISFRGKRTDNGEWVEGYLTRRPSAIQYEAHYSPWYIDKPPSDPDDSGGFYNVDRETVGEFTGLTDKNGKRIFEGDILEYDDYKGYYFIVKFEDGSFGPWVANDFGGYFEAFTNYDGIPPRYSEVIGNIHDNPELIEREAEE